MDMRRRQPIGVELVKRGVVTDVEIERALTYQRENPGKKLGDILYILNLCENPRKLIEAIGDILGAKGILLTVDDIIIKPTDYLALDIAKQIKAIPFEITSGKIKVCFSDTINNKNMDTVRILLLNKGLVMEPYITFESNIDKILKSFEGAVTDNIVSTGQGTNITTLVDSIIKTGIEKRASDIHIEPLSDIIRIRYRIDGELITAARISKEKQQHIIGRLKSISNMHQEKQESQDGRILTYENYNIRVSSQPNVYGEKFVLRLLKKNSNIKNIFELGFPGTEEEFKKSINKKNSITIVAAPTGEGKTTTLYSIIDYFNSPDINITTIEDPVEIRIEGLNQIEIDAKTSFSDSLRTVLRQDPDIILVGEIRDKETGEIAIQAGQTGHYVLSTIHTIDSIEVITRLRKMGLSDYDIASTLATSISQRLVRKICPKCKKERTFTEEEKKIIKSFGDKYNVQFDITQAKTYDTPGCAYCNHTGYYDRIGIFEILDITEGIKEAVMNGESSIDIRKIAVKQGYKPLLVDGIIKVINGFTTLEELNRKLLIY